DVRVLEVGAVVDRGQAELGGEAYAGSGAELVRVQAAPQPPGRARPQRRAVLVAVERALLAERVDPAGVRRGRVEHRAGHQGDVLLRGGAVRDDVRAEERGLLGELAGDREAAGLVLD